MMIKLKEIFARIRLWIVRIFRKTNADNKFVERMIKEILNPSLKRLSRQAHSSFLDTKDYLISKVEEWIEKLPDSINSAFPKDTIKNLLAKKYKDEDVDVIIDKICENLIDIYNKNF